MSPEEYQDAVREISIKAANLIERELALLDGKDSDGIASQAPFEDGVAVGVSVGMITMILDMLKQS